MLHEPRGFIGDLQGAVKLMGANTLFAGRHEVSGLKPDMQLDVAALKNGANRHGELALAGATAAQAQSAALYVRNAVKTTTARAMCALRPNDSLKPSNSCGFIVEMGLRQNGHDGFPLRLIISESPRTCQVYNSPPQGGRELK